jgi:hypothetical protein
MISTPATREAYRIARGPNGEYLPESGRWARARRSPAPLEVESDAPFATIADNGHGVMIETDDAESATAAARLLLDDGEPTPILQYVKGRRALGTYNEIGA